MDLPRSLRTLSLLDPLALLDLFFFFASLTRSPEPTELAKEATKMAEEYPLSALLSASHHDHEGKVVHRTEGGFEDNSVLQRQIAQNESNSATES